MVNIECSYCKQVKECRSCSKCHFRYYCSRQCQVRDWKEHKKECNFDHKPIMKLFYKFITKILPSKEEFRNFQYEYISKILIGIPIYFNIPSSGKLRINNFSDLQKYIRCGQLNSIDELDYEIRIYIDNQNINYQFSIGPKGLIDDEPVTKKDIEDVLYGIKNYIQDKYPDEDVQKFLTKLMIYSWKLIHLDKNEFPTIRSKYCFFLRRFLQYSGYENLQKYEKDIRRYEEKGIKKEIVIGDLFHFVLSDKFFA